MYDKLIKRLRHFPEEYVAYKMDADFARTVRESADAIEKLEIVIAGLNEAIKGFTDNMPLWIPVTERLPEDLTRVIVFCEDGVSFGLCVHLIADDEEFVEWHDFLHYPITPTHWMPLPESPKEE